MDETKNKSQIASAIYCLHSLVYLPIEHEFLSRRFDLHFGSFFIPSDMKLQVSNEPALAPELQKATLDVLGGLVDMQVLQRVLYLVKNSDEQVGDLEVCYLLQIFQTMAYHKPADVIKVLVEDLESVSDLLELSEPNLLQMLTFLRVSVASSRDFAQSLETAPGLPLTKLQSLLLQRSTSFECVKEILRIYRILFLYGLDAVAYLDLFSWISMKLYRPQMTEEDRSIQRCILNLLEALCIGLAGCTDDESTIHWHHIDSIAELAMNAFCAIRGISSTDAGVLHFYATYLELHPFKSQIPESVKAFVSRELPDLQLSSCDFTALMLTSIPDISALPFILRTETYLADDDTAVVTDSNHAIIRLSLALVEFRQQVTGVRTGDFVDLVRRLNCDSGYLIPMSVFIMLQDMFVLLAKSNDKSKDDFINVLKAALVLLETDLDPSISFIRSLFSPFSIELLLHSGRTTAFAVHPEFVRQKLSSLLNILDPSQISSQVAPYLGRVLRSFNPLAVVDSMKLDQIVRVRNHSRVPLVLWSPFKNKQEYAQMELSLVEFLLELLAIIDLASFEVESKVKPTDVALVFLRGSDIFLQPAVNTCLMYLFERSIQRPSDYSAVTFFQDLVDMFNSDSFGDPLFARLLLYYIRQDFPSDHRRIFWQEVSPVLGMIQMDSLIPVPVDEQGFFHPEERDSGVIRLLESALEENDELMTNRNRFLKAVATHHIRSWRSQ
eukprot:TRINITY_DN2110_c0_g1_i1.p1 TRINITY_DN2110_c0_g1~~TRINITY_DN2110_c0_g1_i1.p1  ORF type:complete len:781 (+),score=189.25 TRINITY_DN2110_c0_g1_i1:176-2344(+)